MSEHFHNATFAVCINHEKLYQDDFHFVCSLARTMGFRHMVLDADIGAGLRAWVNEHAVEPLHNQYRCIPT